MRIRRPAPIVVTDMHEPLIVVQRRKMRARLVLFGIWLIGWVVSGILWRDGGLATAILLLSGPGVWLVYCTVLEFRRPGRREAVTPRRKALGPAPAARQGPGGSGAAGGR